ncbi:hypothetical protein [Ideonella oryzae]|uniref:Uncharacterized protein n=1 Tax=Ideonella oryzae TaxID=2937441 RepID=A0ABT1BGC3_9BURK|nr:hypothetical protein [Ideonella oryzae]MCO5975186.1 hypothetical protein [Ideonella oryzae]
MLFAAVRLKQTVTATQKTGIAAAMFGDQLGLSFVIGVAAVLVGLRLTLKAT